MNKDNFAESVLGYCESFGTWRTARKLVNMRVKGLTGLSLEAYSDTTSLMNVIENVEQEVGLFLQTGDTSPIDEALNEITIEFLYSNLLS